MPKLVRTHWWLVFFVLFFPFLIMNMYSDFIRGSELNARFGWLILLGGVAYLFQHTLLKKILLGVIFLFAISGGIDIVYAITFGGVFSNSTFEAIALTDARETLEFLQAYVSFENIVILIVYWLIAFYSLKQVLFKEAELTREKVFATLGVLMLFVAMQQINLRNRAFDTIPGFTGVAIDYIKEYEALESVIDDRVALYSNSDFNVSIKSDKPQTFVIVVGESLGRRHMSLYGYGRDTTPNLRLHSSESIVFSNVISAFAQTKPSLSVNLTEKDTVNNKPLPKSLSLIAVFKRAGFKTFWLSNQEPLKVPTKPIATIADEQYFVSNDFHGVTVNRHDGLLLPKVIKALNNEADHKVIFVHLMGSHLKYKNRFPASKAVFLGDNTTGEAYTKELSNSQLGYINAYDNSIHYTDYLLGKILSHLKSNTGVAALIFWSDHGEEVFDTKDFKGHAPDAVTAPMLEVPFVFWRNQVYRESFKKIDEVLMSHTETPIMLDDFFNIAQCMIPVNSDLFNRGKSLCLPEYEVKPRIVYGKDYDKGLK